MHANTYEFINTEPWFSDLSVCEVSLHVIVPHSICVVVLFEIAQCVDLYECQHQSKLNCHEN